MAVCRHCGANAPANASFCDQCGVPLAPAGRRMPVPPGTRIVQIGREADNDVRVPFSVPGVSRHHARVLVLPDQTMLVEDLGSRAGTWVNGIRTSGPTSFTLADEVRLGPSHRLNKALFVALRSSALADMPLVTMQVV